MGTSKRSPPQASGTFEILSRSEEETGQLGERLGRAVEPGDVIALIGELGSGKTTLIRGLARGLGIDPNRVKSPTFVLLREYAGRVPLIHIDGYRLEGPSAVIWEDLDWMFSPKKATVIEWADRFEGCLPQEHLQLRLAHKSTSQRTIQVSAHGPRSQRLLELVQDEAAGD